jgi:putative acetyltransferase
MIHRPLVPLDLPVLHGLYMEPETNRFLDYEPMDEDTFRVIFDGLVCAQETSLVLEGERVLGTYRLHVQPFRCAHVATLGGFAIAPSARGRGLGGEILEAIVAGLPARGIRRLELLVEADNARAIRFYEKHRFVREGVLRGAFRREREPEDVDEIAMARRV